MGEFCYEPQRCNRSTTKVRGGSSPSGPSTRRRHGLKGRGNCQVSRALLRESVQIASADTLLRPCARCPVRLSKWILVNGFLPPVTHDLPEYENPKRARTPPPVHCGPLVDPAHALTPVLHSCARCSCSRSSGRRLNPAPPRPARVRACAAPAQEDEKLPPAPYETVKDAPGSNVDGEGAQWSSGLAHSRRERVA